MTAAVIAPKIENRCVEKNAPGFYNDGQRMKSRFFTGR